MNGSAGSPSAVSGIAELTQCMHRLEAQMAAVTDAVEVLVRGLESTSWPSLRTWHVEGAARRAHELLLLARSLAPAR